MFRLQTWEAEARCLCRSSAARSAGVPSESRHGCRPVCVKLTRADGYSIGCFNPMVRGHWLVQTLVKSGGSSIDQLPVSRKAMAASIDVGHIGCVQVLVHGGCYSWNRLDGDGAGPDSLSEDSQGSSANRSATRFDTPFSLSIDRS